MALGAGGCAVIPLATFATVLGIASTAATAGPEVYQQGKLDSALMANYHDVRQAVRRAARDLGLRVLRDRQSGCGWDWDFKLEDDRGSKMEVTIQKRAANLCRCRVNVGLFGSEPTAKLVMSQIRAEINPKSDVRVRT
jgi:Protein of unknown function (DUF3568)